MGVKIVVVAGVLGACVPLPQTPHQPPVNEPAPSVLRASYLQVGQWAQYEERLNAASIGDLRLEAIGNADCGTWVRAQITGGGGDHRWVLCVDEDQAGYHVTRALVDPGDGAHPIDLQHPGAYAAELAVLQSRVAPPSLTGAYTREDVDVPAGHFAGTLVATDAPRRTWLHPHVPFGGVVKIADAGGRTDVLVASGDIGADVEPWFRRGARSRAGGRRGHRWIAFGGTVAWTAATEGHPSSTGPGLMAMMGIGFARTLELVTHVGTAGDATRLAHAGLGVRWSPVAARGFYLQSTAGYANVQGLMSDRRDMFDQGIGMANSVGYLAHDRRHDWALGLYVEHQLAYLVDGKAWTQGVGGGFTVQLDW